MGKRSDACSRKSNGLSIAEVEVKEGAMREEGRNRARGRRISGKRFARPWSRGGKVRRMLNAKPRALPAQEEGTAV